MKNFATFLIAVLLAVLPCTSPAQQFAENTEMSVIAEGSAAVIDKDIAQAEDEALASAKRNAVEKAVGVFVRSEAVGEDYHLVDQTILTRSEGYISSWNKIDGSRKIENVDGAELLTLKISAKVKLVNLIDDMTNVEEIYNSMQRPRIMVLISEKIDGQKTSSMPISADSITRALQQKNFDVVDPEVTRNILKNQSTRNLIQETSTKKASGLAMAEGAEILLLGTAGAMAGPAGVAGDVKCGVAVLNARMVYANTGEILFTAKQIEGRGACFGDDAEAKAKALDDAGNRLIASDSNKFISQLIAHWALEVQNGRLLRLGAKNVSFAQFNTLKKSIRDFRGHVEFVGQPVYKDKCAMFMVRSKLTPDQFRDRLSRLRIQNKVIEIEESSGTAIGVTLK